MEPMAEILTLKVRIEDRMVHLHDDPDHPLQLTCCGTKCPVCADCDHSMKTDCSSCGDRPVITIKCFNHR